MKFLTPEFAQIRRMLSALLGSEVDVELSSPNGNDRFAAVYTDAGGNPAAVAICDSAFAAYVGSALSILPKDVAETAAAGDTLTDVMKENLHEVMNVCTRLLIDDNTPHLVLSEICSAYETDATLTLREAGQRTDFRVEIPRYGAGNLAFLIS